jgi:hypothetical protein
LLLYPAPFFASSPSSAWAGTTFVSYKTLLAHAADRIHVMVTSFSSARGQRSFMRGAEVSCPNRTCINHRLAHRAKSRLLEVFWLQSRSGKFLSLMNRM